MTYYLAIDIGASSGRHILGSVKDGKIQIEEIYRFENNLEKHGDSLCWNIENLFTEVKNGLKKCSEIGKFPKQSPLTHGALTMFFLMKTKMKYSLPFHTVTVEQRKVQELLMQLSHKPSFIHAQVYRSRASTQSISFMQISSAASSIRQSISL